MVLVSVNNHVALLLIIVVAAVAASPHTRRMDPRRVFRVYPSSGSGSSKHQGGKMSKGKMGKGKKGKKGHHVYPTDDDSRDLDVPSTMFGKNSGQSGYYENNDVVVKCTVKGTTERPRYPWCPETVDCAAIAEGTAATAFYDVESYSVDFTVEIDGDVSATLHRIVVFLQQYVATDLAGCNSYYHGPGNIDNVVFEVASDSSQYGTLHSRAREQMRDMLESNNWLRRYRIGLQGLHECRCDC